MILVVCTDDPNLLHIAVQSSNAHPQVFGHPYQVFVNPMPVLGQNEALFVIAHGAMRGDDGNPVIGDEDMRRAFYLNAVQLYQGLQDRFPAGYAANVYIDACESSDHDEDTFSFAEAFKSQVQPGRPLVRVFGRNGVAAGLIPLPGSAGWREA